MPGQEQRWRYDYCKRDRRDCSDGYVRITPDLDIDIHYEGSRTIIGEEPSCTATTLYQYTNNYSERGDRVRDGILRLYFPYILMHEFRHTLGLQDLKAHDDYLMSKNIKVITIPEKDAEYSKNLYYEENGG